MFDKKLSLGISSVLAVIASSSAFANVGNDLSCINSLNSNPGLYVGFQAGIAQADYGDTIKNLVESTPFYDIRDSGAALRLLTGWNFNQYFAAEAGYSFLPTNDYRVNDINGNQVVDFKERTKAVDLVGKASLPVNEHISVYAKAGGAYVRAKANGTSSTLGDYEAKTSSIEPTYGLGVAYHVNQNVSVDASWSQIYGHDSYTSSEPLTLNTPMVNFFGLGMNYKFN